MTHRAIKLNASDNTIEVVEIKGPLDYPQLNAELFGDEQSYIEFVHVKGLLPLQERENQMLVLLIDEDGLRKQLEMNLVASYLYGVHMHGSVIVGDAYLVAETPGPEGLELTPLPEGITPEGVMAAVGNAIVNPNIFD